MNSNWSYSPETPNKGLNWWLFDNWDIEILQMTLKTNREPLPWYFKLCASFCSHWWAETGVTVRKRPIWVNIGEFLSPVTLKFDGWPWKTIGHLFYATSSYLHHSVAIGEFKLVLQSGNAQSGSKFAFKLCDLNLWPGHFTWTSLLAMHSRLLPKCDAFFYSTCATVVLCLY